MLIRATNFIKMRRFSQKLQKISDYHIQSPGIRRNVALRHIDVASQDPPKAVCRSNVIFAEKYEALLQCKSTLQTSAKHVTAVD